MFRGGLLLARECAVFWGAVHHNKHPRTIFARTVGPLDRSTALLSNLASKACGAKSR